MCGIAGIVSHKGNRLDPALLFAMMNSLRHRGPDDEGYLLVNTANDRCLQLAGDDSIAEAKASLAHIKVPRAENYNVGLCWRRLGIIDLSPTGHQPMSNGDGTIWLLFNGEIYNYVELRDELVAKGYRFKTKTDSEVILHGYEEWGYECLNHFNGMWAFALWDGRTKKLFCARDRFGVKPLYYFQRDSVFAYASEIKALLLHPAVSRSANQRIVYDYLAHATIDHTDETFFTGIKQLPPSHYLTIDDTGALEVKKYYSLGYNSEFGRFDGAENEKYAARFKELLFDSVRIRMRTDVPLGSCLSGGLDSSTIVCMANKLMLDDGVIDRALIGEHQKTFTAVYNDPALAGLSERPFVEKIISSTNANPYFIEPTGEQLWNELPTLMYHQDEPFNSTSAYAQWNVMRLAHEQNIKVLLDGQGSDELLGGYPWHVPIYQSELFRRFRFGSLWNELSSISSISHRPVVTQLVELFGKTARGVLPQSAFSSFIPSHKIIHPDIVSAHVGMSPVIKKKNHGILQGRLHQEVTALNLQQLLHYEDRNSMAFSIEARVPFLDYRVVEYGMQIPAAFKIHNGWSKYPLRCAGDGILPHDIQWRKDKMGFFTPQDEWTRMLHPKIQTMLLNEPLRAEHFLNKTVLRQLTQRVHSSSSNAMLWRAINLEMWMRVFEVA